MRPTLSVLMLAYGQEEYLDQAVRAVLASTGVDLELVLVDNGCTSDAVRDLPADARLRVLVPGTNLGFAGGVVHAADVADGAHLALVNSDAVVEPDALAVLVDRLADPAVGIAGALVLLAGEDDVVNSAGNPLHVLGLSWAGRMGRPADEVVEGPVPSASGACLALRADLWDDLGGFAPEYFAYLEDLELGWRVWQRGLEVRLVPQARAHHHYEFSRSPLKMYLVERNRLVVLATCHERRTLLLLAPVLLAFEAAIAVVAAIQGWGGQKLRGWVWVVRNLRWLRERRALVQRTRTVRDSALVGLITDRFDPAQTPLPPVAAPLELALRAYWRLVRRLV